MWKTGLARGTDFFWVGLGYGKEKCFENDRNSGSLKDTLESLMGEALIGSAGENVILKSINQYCEMG